MPKTSLTDMQRVILSGAAMRPDYRVLPVPKSIQRSATAIALSIRPLLDKGLVVEMPAEASDVVWRQDPDAGKIALVIAAAGMEAIGVAPDDGVADGSNNWSGKTSAPTAVSSDAVTAAAAGSFDDRKLPREGSKLALLLNALRRPAGATNAELVEATGWQAHSIRGAISGTLKKKLGLEITSETIDGRGRVYRVAADKPVADEPLASGASQ